MWVFSHNLNFMSEIKKESDSKRKIMQGHNIVTLLKMKIGWLK